MENKTAELRILIPDPGLYPSSSGIESKFSFEPYYRQIKKELDRGNSPFESLYRYILHEFEIHRELHQPITDFILLEKHALLFQMVVSSLFPFSADQDVQYFSLSTPYKFEIPFYSKSFADYFSPDEAGHVKFHPERPFSQIEQEHVLLAYRMIFRKFYQKEIRVPERKTNRWLDKSTGLHRYSRLHIDESFVDVKLKGQLPEFPGEYIDRSTGTISDINGLKQKLPLHMFSFEGFFLRRSIVDVTAEECVTLIKNALIEMQSNLPEPGYDKLISAVETLIGLRDVKISLSPFLSLNERYIFFQAYSGRSWLINHIPEMDYKEMVYNQLAVLLNKEKGPVIFGNLFQQGQTNNDPLLRFLKKTTANSYLIIPLFNNRELIGMLEIAAPVANALHAELLKKLETVYAFFEMACRNYLDRFRNEIESLVKERFTALQPIVEWKFLEEAWIYLRKRDYHQQPEMGTVSFDKVYPVFGAIDIRNSSTERNFWMRKDLLDQLHFLDATIGSFDNHILPTVNEYIQYLARKNQSLTERINENFIAEDESLIQDFLEKEVKVFFRHLSANGGKEADPARYYLAAADPEKGQLFQHRRKFDESLHILNNNISRHLETARHQIQQFYPHYFEKFRTDGVEYNIYIGESFTPMKAFDLIYLKNIRLWQMSTMAEIARITYKLNKELPIPLQTTQLILVYGHPICISFRKDERRFDVEGSDSIRFEILKKRLDKARIRKTGERLTQPNTIAVVYTHEKEASEFDEYFSFLKKKNLLEGEKEILELEDVQGVSGIKAIRFYVKLED